MTNYTAPISDIQFLMHQWLNIREHYQLLGYTDASDPELIDAIIEEGGRFASEVLAPLNSSGDQEGCRFDNGEVTTPKGFKEAYQLYCDNGWPSLNASTEYGGQGLPYSLAMTIAEMVASANTAWGMYSGLSQGVIEALSAHGTQEQKSVYLPKMISGEWTGTMCLTEPHCGSDLGILKTKAIPQDDESYLISGTKIFISAGEHDLSKNIIHLALARLPDAPEGTKGISLFVVPKFNLSNSGEIIDRNSVSCGSIEHKMGINGSSTAVLNFDNAKGYLVGTINKGLQGMFTMMNAARLATGLQGQALAETSYQGALAYAKDRLQMRSLNGSKFPEKPADPIIVHPDVRRMLLTQKAFSQGCRAMAYYVATLVDKEHCYEGEQKDNVLNELSFLTPICKGFMTEVGHEATQHGIQILGGHGYIKEWGMEQLARDARIAQIYEGTNGIQALDLLGRKVLMDKMSSLRLVQKQIKEFCKKANQDKSLKPMAKELNNLVKKWFMLTLGIARRSSSDRDEVGAASFDFLMYSGYIYLGYIWLQLAYTANKEETLDPSFKQSKLTTCQFYFDRILPRVKSHAASIKSGSDNLMNIPDDIF